MHQPDSPVTPPPGAAVLVVRAVAVAGAYYLAATVGLAFRSEPEKLAVFWPPNGLLLGLLLLSRPAGRRLVTLSAAAACFLANLTGGNSVPVSAGFTAVNVAEPCAVAWVLRKLGTGDTRLERTADVFLLFGVALGVCLLAAVPGAAVVVVGLGAPSYRAVLVTFWLSDAMAYMLVAPLVLAWGHFDWRAFRPQSVWCGPEALALFAGLTALAAVIFTEDGRSTRYFLSYPFPLFPLFVCAALRFGVRGSALAVFVLALIAIWSTGHGRGPFAEPGLPPRDYLLMVQFFLSSLSLAALALSAALAERRAARDALRESEARYREVTETMEEAFWVIRPDYSATIYISPAYARIWGRSCASAYADPRSFLEGVHPDDRGRVAAALSKQARGTYDEEYRVVRPDGTERWVRSRAFALRDDTGAVVRVVGVSQDVTERKDAELAKESLIEQLQKALAEVRTLRGMIPVCAWCRKVRDDGGFWQSVEEYICSHTDAEITHGMCPACFATQMEAVAARRGG